MVPPAPPPFKYTYTQQNIPYKKNNRIQFTKVKIVINIYDAKSYSLMAVVKGYEKSISKMRLCSYTHKTVKAATAKI